MKDHGFAWGYTWTKTFLQSRGLLPKAPRKGAHRRKRERRPLPGMMMHQDGSRHVWLEGQPALDLIATLDDATGAIYSAVLVEEEGTASTFRALKETFGAHGLPMSLYTDRGSHYFHTAEVGGKIDRSRLTQVGRALEQLGVEHIGAYSPQARGRSERAFQTLQERLVKELKLAGITAIEAANAFIREVYLPAHNERFAVAPAQPGSAFTPIPGVDSMRSCACRRSARSATTIACPTARSNCRSRRARCGRTSSRRGSRSITTGWLARRLLRPALHRPLRPERSDPGREKRRLNPLGGAPVGLWATQTRCPQSHRKNRSRRSGHLMCYQNRTS